MLLSFRVMKNNNYDQEPEQGKHDKYSYTDKLTGKRLSFKPSQKEIILTFYPEDIGSIENTFNALFSKELITVLNVNQEIGFARIQVTTGNSKKLLDHLNSSEDVIEAIPAFIPTGEGNNLARYYLPGRFTLQFADDYIGESKKFIKEEKLKVISYPEIIPGYYTLELPEGKELFDLIRNYNELKEIRFAAPDECYFGGQCWEPGDDAYRNGTLWHLKQTPNDNFSIKAKDAWNRQAGSANYTMTLNDIVNTWGNVGGENTIAAVIDSGVKSTHSSLSPNLLTGKNILDNSTNTPDNDGHGTAVMGNIISITNSVISPYFVVASAPKAKGTSIKFLETYAGGWLLSNLRKAIYYVGGSSGNPDFPAGGLAVTYPSNRYVICIPVSYTSNNSEVHDAITQAVGNKVVVVCAAGNEGVNLYTDPRYPASYPEVLAVGAIDTNGNRWIDPLDPTKLSNYYHNSSNPNPVNNPIISVPGQNIYTTTNNDINTYGAFSGTSMSAGIVTGILLQMWRRDFKRNGGSLNFIKTAAQMTTYAKEACDAAPMQGYFRGRINAYNALGRVAN